MKKLLLLLAAVGMIFTACQDGLDNEENGGTPSTPKIELSQQNIEVDFKPAQYSVSVTSPYLWEAISENDWIQVETATGIAGTKELKFSVLHNEVMESREGTIVIKNSDYNLIAELHVIQKAFTPEITITPEKLTFAVEGGTQEVTITANFEYGVSKSADWITYSKTNSGITITVPPYDSENMERMAKLIISSEKYGVSEFIEVNQKAFVPEITIKPERLTFAVEGGTQEVTITTNFEYEVTESADWITYSKTNNGITITASFNQTIEQRSADIHISNDKYGSKSVKVTQKSLYKNHFITYTSSDGSVVAPNETKAFGANIISNIYENGKGVIIFNAPVTSIGDKAFYECSSLTSVTIPDSVTSIGDKAFYKCSSLTSVLMSNGTKTIGDRAFAFCGSMTDFTIPNSVTSILDYAFARCYSLTSITIGNSVTSIGTYAFRYCSSLKSITIPDSVQKIGEFAFEECSLLTSITIGNGVTSIGYMTFKGCSSLTSVIIPDSVTSIGNGAFYDCTSLTSVYCKPATPPTAVLVGDEWNAFNNNASGRKIYVPTNSVDSYKAASYWSNYASYIEGYDF